jgi:metallophosphoesterase (TIGR00282 family)
MNILVIGDIVGAPGRRAVLEHLPVLRAQHRLDLVIANVENIADGAGVTPESAEALLAAGVDLLTSGNHIWDKSEAFDYIARQPRLLRPHNYPEGTPGRGWTVVEAANGCRVGVLNLLGNVYMHPHLDCPFRCADRVLGAKPSDLHVVLVDFHAEATSEKTALGWYLDGRVSAIVGTHTHIPTADERVLPRGTAYITDIGMCGCYDSVIGMDIQKSLRRFVHKLPARFDVAEGPGTLCAVLLDVDETSGRCRSIERLRRPAASADATVMPTAAAGADESPPRQRRRA